MARGEKIADLRKADTSHGGADGDDRVAACTCRPGLERGVQGGRETPLKSCHPDAAVEPWHDKVWTGEK